ncbi:FAD-dependent oxidoreductase [Rhodococcoides trifolii]|uniref:FAD-dependent oxidoreductase n=1 Tax=Rhodococcoides trifolii TaxID=908250 RepID=A0A917D486_9NOCA|nr:FAD-dependent monooxygenase [Rhodococcus trifolii]GGG09404.1 FAD-dependent oxidoreductase [Rhodococcus trifolii]
MNSVDVIVIGAGPAGCMLAGEIARTGHSVVVLDKRDGVSPHSRAFAVHARTLELLDTRGLADDLIATGTITHTLSLWRGASVDLSRLRTPFPYVLVTPQVHVDRALETYARTQGARVERGVTVTGLEQDDAGVRVRAVSSDGTEQTWTAEYAVGADGVHSTVRGLLGQAFPGREVLRSMVLSDAKLDRPPTDAITVNVGGDCFAFLAPYGEGWFRVIAWDRRAHHRDDAPVELEEVRGLLQRAMGTDYGLSDIRWYSRFACDERQVEQYRTGRVVLVGDAAHAHSPAGGQGMNTGIQDAANLGWKLAAALDGAPNVLDTYQDERHPVGKMVLRTSGLTIRTMTMKPAIVRRLRQRLVSALVRRHFVSDLVTRTFSGIGISYARGRGDHPLVGTRVSDVRLTDGTVADALQHPGFLLVAGRGDDRVQAPVPVVRRADDGPSILVRPDGYIAWAGDHTSREWRTALSRWTGSTPATADAG